MKRTKKFFAMLLALTMVLGMTMTASAETSLEKTTITVNGLPAEVVADTENGIEAVEVDVTYAHVVIPNTTDVQGWVFAPGFAEAFKEAFDVDSDDEAIGKLIELGELEDTTNNYYVTNGFVNTGGGDTENQALASAFAEAIAEIPTVTDDSVKAPTGTSTAWTIEAKDAGLYVINATATGYEYITMAAYVGYTYNGNATALNPVTVTAKGSESKIVKINDNEDDKSVAAGDVVEYTATTKYPYYGPNTTDKTFVVTDVVTNATYNEESVKVYLDVNGEGITFDQNGEFVPGEGENKDVCLIANTDYSIAFPEKAETDEFTDKFVITFTDKYNSTYAGKTLVVKYNVTVLESVDDLENTVTTTFDEDGSSVIIDKVKASVVKVDKNDANSKLKNAEFTLYVAVEEEEALDSSGELKVGYVEIVEAENGIEPVYGKTFSTIVGVEKEEALDSNGELKDGYVEIDTEVYGKKNSSVAITNEDGIATFYGLDADGSKTYYVQETKAPEGYSLNDEYVVLSGATANEPTTVNDVTTYSYTDFANVTVEDTKLIALPSTGGIGTTIFTVAGCGIMIAAAFFFFASRKKEN